MTDRWLASFEVGFPAESVDELLLALVCRDLVYGTSYDVEAEGTGDVFQVDITASEEINAEDYQLLVEAEIRGVEDSEQARAFLQQILEEAVDEAESLVGRKKQLAVVGGDDMEFRAVKEDEERWDLVIPDWLAPEGAEVPFGFRSFMRNDGTAYPSNEDLDREGRIVVVPFGSGYTLFALPAPEGSAKNTD